MNAEWCTVHNIWCFFLTVFSNFNCYTFLSKCMGRALLCWIHWCKSCDTCLQFRKVIRVFDWAAQHESAYCSNPLLCMVCMDRAQKGYILICSSAVPIKILWKMEVNVTSSAAQFSLRDKLGQGSGLISLLCLLCQNPLIEPRQGSCGDRICSTCYNSLLAR